MKLEITNKKDFEEIAKIYSEEFSKPPYEEDWTLKKALTKLKLFSKYCDIWKIISQNEIVGFIIINPNQWCPGNIIFGEEMAIKSEFQNRKIATKAIKKIFSYYKTKGYKTFMGIINKNSKSFGLFKKAGLNQSSESVLMEGDIK